VKIGILGGTFDPIHMGHLAIAQEAAEELQLPRVLFIPAPRPPHKQKQAMSDVVHRVAMVRVAIEDNPLFQLSTVELERDGPSYTVDTLAQLRGVFGEETELFYIVGGDAPGDLLSWREPERILTLATVVVVTRPGYTETQIEQLRSRLPAARTRIRALSGPQYGISATDIRVRVESGRSIRYLVPPDVHSYIARHGLYRSQS